MILYKYTSIQVLLFNIMQQAQGPRYYNTDTGDRDLGTEKTLSSNTSFTELWKQATSLKAHLIIQTSPGTYYIKGYTHKRNYNEIKNILETNQSQGKYSKRKAWLISYT